MMEFGQVMRGAFAGVASGMRLQVLELRTVFDYM